MKRAGFTLVELLVVMALMAILAALAIRFIPSAVGSAREARAGMGLQGWLNIAKQTALRDQSPRGLRLFVTSATIGNATIANAVIECQYLEVPDDFTGNGAIQSGTPLPPPALPAGYYNAQNCINFAFPAGTDLFNGYPPAHADMSSPPVTYAYWSVQPGDTIELLASGLTFRITDVGVPDASGNPQQCVRVDPPLPFLVTAATRNFRILRSPRPVGDLLKMPTDTIIDVGTNAKYGNPLPVPPNGAVGSIYYDILFSPTGAVISPGVATDKLHLWVRAPNPDDGVNGADWFRGEPTLISIFVRTGAVGAYLVNPNVPPGPYDLVK